MSRRDSARAGVRPLRADAAANRDRVLAAAVTTMLKEGRSVPLSRIAKEANVGVATLYRSYPNRESLIEALEVRALRLVIDLLVEVNEKAQPGAEAVREFLHRTVEHGNQLVLPYHGAPAYTSVEASHLQHELDHQVAELVAGGIQDGTLRDDLEPRDVIVFGALMAQPLPTIDDWQAIASRQIDFFMAAVEKPMPVSGDAPRTRSK